MHTIIATSSAGQLRSGTTRGAANNIATATPIFTISQNMVKLNAAAKTGNIDAIKAAVGEVGKSCKACHDSYRKE